MASNRADIDRRQDVKRVLVTALVINLSLTIVNKALKNTCSGITVGLLFLELPQSVGELLDLLCLLVDLLILGPLLQS